MIGLAKWSLCAVLLISVWFENNVTGAGNDGNNRDYEPSYSRPDNSSHSRQKRMLWITSDGRLALPPGTSLTIEPSLSLPFVRFPPDGFKSGMSISLPFTIEFDELGLTDNENPYGAFPSIWGKSMGRKMSSVLSGYVAQLMGGGRSRRSVPTLPKPIHSYFQGGERAVLYTVVEDVLSKFGMDGKACLLRAICEVNSHKSIHKFGFIGELLQLFLKASRSSYSKFMTEYVDAETVGKHKEECYPYFKDCRSSLFTVKNIYSKTDSSSDDEAPGRADDDGENDDDDVQKSAGEFDDDVNDVNDDREKSAGAKNVAVTPAVPFSM